MLDLGKLSAEENQQWVFKGASCLYPDYRRCLVSLSRGGADAVEVREFDTVSKQFVKDGFRTPESKGTVTWRDADTVYVAIDFGSGTMTRSGYPRVVKEWKRGTPLTDARSVFEASESDVGVGAEVVNEPARKYELVSRDVTFWEQESRIRVGDGWVPVDAPRDSVVSVFNGMLILRLRSEWKPAQVAFKAGSLVSTSLDRFLAGGRDFEVLFESTPRTSLQSFAVTRGYVLLNILDNVKSRIVEARLEGGRWKTREASVPAASTISVSAVDRDDSDD